tara:strand:+ start:762 stop:1880 length:1119 start_codon:yes stop_codon:yes gene_type:complete
MKKNNFVILFTTLFLLLSVSCDVFADMVYLKNGKQLEGIIEGEDEESINMNIGFGKVTFKKADISRIVRYTYEKQVTLKRELGYKYFGQPEFIPQELKTMIAHLKKIEELRDTATEAKIQKNADAEEIDRLDKGITKLNDELVKTSRDLSSFRIQNDPKKYNALIESFNSLQAKIKLLEYDKDSLKKKTPALDEKVSKYITELNIFRKKFKQEYSTTQTKENQQRLLENVQKRIDNMGVDFIKHTIEYDFLGSSIIVKVLLNDTVIANLILDTGASIVVLSKEIADKLNLTFDRKTQSGMVTLADGRKVKANITFLESVKIGKLEARNVKAAILEHEEATTDNGLLGMSFLKNFMLKIDPNSKKLILEEFNP